MNIKFCLLSAVVAFTASCAPQAKYLDIEANTKAEHELTLTDGNVAVFFVPSKGSDSLDNVMDSLLLSKVAVAAAGKIERDKNFKSESINVFSIPKNEFCGFGKAADENYFIQLTANSGADVLIFLRDLFFYKYTVHNISNEYDSDYNSVQINIPYTVKMEVYNSLQDSLLFSNFLSDTVYVKALSSYGTKGNYNNVIVNELPGISEKIGEKLASALSRQWETQTIMLIDYEFLSNWTNACSMAMDEFKWEEAIKLWMPYTQSESPKKSSYAGFNIAVGCQMMEQPDIALQWIDFAQKQYNFRELQQLKKMVEESKK